MAIDTNESLELIVAADADKAGKEIDELVDKLDKVIEKLEKSKDASKKHLYLDGLKDARKDLADLGKGLSDMKANKFGSPIDSAGWKKAIADIDTANERLGILKHSAEGLMWIAERPTVSRPTVGSDDKSSDKFAWMDGQRERYLNSLKRLYEEIGVLQEKIDGSKTGQLSFAKGTDKVRKMKMELFAAQNEANLLRKRLGETDVPSGTIHKMKTLAKSFYMSAMHARLLNKESKKTKASVIDMSRALSLMAFRFAVRTVMRLTREGLENLAQFSRETDNVFNGAMSKMKSGVTQLKNAFATAIAPIIQAIQPLVTKIINVLIGAFNKVSLFMASLFGQKTFYKALPVVEDYAASLDDAANNAKKLNKQLMGIDELTVLQDNSDSGANDGNAKPSEMFTIEQVGDYQNPIRNMIDSVKRKIEEFVSWFRLTWEKITTWFNTKIVEPIRNSFSNLWTKIKDIWNPVAGWFSSNVIQPVVGLFQNAWRLIGQFAEGCWLIIEAVWITVSDWFSEHIIEPIKEKWNEFFGPLGEDFKKFGAEFMEGWKNYKNKLQKEVIEPLKEAWKIVTTAIGGFFSDMWSGIKKGAASALNVMISRLESWINNIINGINLLIGGFNKIAKWAAKVVGADYGGVDLIKPVSLGRINAYATGGVIEDGLFTMNHGEIAGRFDNGKTVVANNQMIVDGIADGVYRAVVAAMGDANKGDSAPPVVKVYLDGKEMKNRQQQLNRAYGW